MRGETAATQSPLTVLRLLALVLIVSCAPPSSHGGPVQDHVSFVDALRSRGLKVDPLSHFSSPAGIRGLGTRLAVSGGAISEATIDSYNYDPTDLRPIGDATKIAEEDTAAIRAADPRKIAPGPFHAYRRERVIVIYAGDDAGVTRLLTDVLGPEISASR